MIALASGAIAPSSANAASNERSTAQSVAQTVHLVGSEDVLAKANSEAPCTASLVDEGEKTRLNINLNRAMNVETFHWFYAWGLWGRGRYKSEYSGLSITKRDLWTDIFYGYVILKDGTRVDCDGRIS